MVEAFRYVTGLDTSLDDLLAAGERAVNLARCFNVREGISRKDDRLPLRFQQPLPDGPCAGERVTAEDLQTMLSEYYTLRGWDSDGKPTEATLTCLGVQGAASRGAP